MSSHALEVPRNNQVAPLIDASILEKVLAMGDLSKLTAQERLSYLNAVCQSVGLNPLTRPFEFISLQGKLVMYARKDATEQLRANNTISIEIVEKTKVDDLYVIRARATTPEGRQDEEIGAVNIANKKGDDLANAMMKAVTKAKRRVTLSICGLGFLDESELETIASAKPVSTPEQFQPRKIENRVAVEFQRPVEPRPETEPIDVAAIPQSDAPAMREPGDEPEEPDRIFVDGESMSSQQRKAVWALGEILYGKDGKDKGVHDLIWEMGKVQSVEHLSKKGASAVIERLNELKASNRD